MTECSKMLSLIHDFKETDSKSLSNSYFSISLCHPPCGGYLCQHLRNPICLLFLQTKKHKILLVQWVLCGWVTCISIIVFPKPYQKPPAPTRFDSRTLQASAFNAFRTRDPKGVGMIKSAQSLHILLGPNGQ